MNTIRLSTVVYDETGNFMLGLKNNISFFNDGKVIYNTNNRSLDELIEEIRERCKYFHREINTNSSYPADQYRNITKEIKVFLEHIKTRLNNISRRDFQYDFTNIQRELLSENIKVDRLIYELTAIIKAIDELRRQPETEDRDRELNEIHERVRCEERPKVEAKILFLEYVANELSYPNSRGGSGVIFDVDGGKGAFPSDSIKGQWIDFFVNKAITNCHSKTNAHPIEEMRITRDCNNKNSICFDIPDIPVIPQERCIWVVKDACALKTLLKHGVDIFKNHFGGYDLFHQLVDDEEKRLYDDFLNAKKSGKAWSKKLGESKVISIDFETYYCDEETLLNEDGLPQESPNQVAIYIKLDKASYKKLEHQVQHALALGAEYANEIMQGLYKEETIKDKNAPKTNDFNRLIENQRLHDWSRVQARPWEVSDSAVNAIHRLQELEAIVRQIEHDKKNHRRDLIRLREQIDLLIKSNNTTVKDIFDNYNNGDIKPFGRNNEERGTDKANHALYQIIVEYNNILESMENNSGFLEKNINRILEIPKKFGKHQIIKQIACSKIPKAIDVESEYCDDEPICDTNWYHSYSSKKIRKNVWPQVNKIYRLDKLKEQKYTLKVKMNELMECVIEQRSWQSFIINIRQEELLRKK